MNRRIVIVTAVATVGLLAAWFFALWQPKGEELSAERDRLAAAEDAASQLETRILKLKQSKANGPKLLARLDTLRSAVPDSPNLPQFILDANDAAVASGVAFVSISPREPAPSTSPGLPPEIGLGVQIEGGYFQVLDFLERLTDMQRVIVLDAVNVSPMGEESGSPQLSVSLNGRMFTTQLPASAIPDPGAAAGQSTPESTTTTTQVPA
jgi:Tfp pilus assembly protein PilO